MLKLMGKKIFTSVHSNILFIPVTCVFSVKYIGFFTAVLILYLVAKDYWRMLGDYSRSDVSLTM